jgi:hypothetical protein
VSSDLLWEFCEVHPEVLDTKKASFKYAKKLLELSQESTGADLNLWEFIYRRSRRSVVGMMVSGSNKALDFSIGVDYYELWNVVTEWMQWRKEEHGQAGDNGWFRHGVRLLARFQYYTLSKGKSNWMDPNGKARQPYQRDEATGRVVSKKRKAVPDAGSETDQQSAPQSRVNHIASLRPNAPCTDLPRCSAPAPRPPAPPAQPDKHVHITIREAPAAPSPSPAAPSPSPAAPSPSPAAPSPSPAAPSPSPAAPSPSPAAPSAFRQLTLTGSPPTLAGKAHKAHEAPGLRAPPCDLHKHLRTAARITPLIKYLHAKKKYALMGTSQWNCIREWCQTQGGVDWLKAAGLDPLSFHLHHVKARACGGLYSVYNCVFLPGSANGWFGKLDTKEMREYIGEEAAKISDRHAQWVATKVIDQSKFDLGM